MSVDDRVVQYTRALFAAEDPVLTAIRERHAAAELPDIFISPDEARLIQVLLRAVGARRVLEVGTLGGYSGVWMVRALPLDGTLVTIERDAARATVAQEAFARAGLADRVELIVGDARQLLPTLAPEFDAVFLDADKEPLEAYYHEAMRLLRVGGLLLCDNAFIHGRVVDDEDHEADVEGVRALNRLAAHDARLCATIVPIRDGLTVGLKVSA
jgi:predicted O-methyltransferase YrrM